MISRAEDEFNDTYTENVKFRAITKTEFKNCFITHIHFHYLITLSTGNDLSKKIKKPLVLKKKRVKILEISLTY